MRRRLPHDRRDPVFVRLANSRGMRYQGLRAGSTLVFDPEGMFIVVAVGRKGVYVRRMTWWERIRDWWRAQVATWHAKRSLRHFRTAIGHEMYRCRN